MANKSETTAACFGKNGKSVRCADGDFKSIGEASLWLIKTKRTNAKLQSIRVRLSHCLHSVGSTAYGYRWEFAT